MLKTNIFKLFAYMCLFHHTTANANDCIGVKIGETSIEPIITGIEFDNNPNVASIQDTTNCIQYNLSTLEFSIILFAIFCFFSGHNSNEKIL